MVPNKAQLVAVFHEHNISIWNVAHLLLSHPAKRYNLREYRIKQIFVHKSGADGPSGFRGYMGCSKFCVNRRKWPGVPYHYWLAQEPDKDTNGNLVIYQGQPDNIISWHTGGANTWSLGIGVQGNYDGEWDLVDGLPKITREPTRAQMTMLDALVKHLLIKNDLPLLIGKGKPSLSGHWEAPRPKAICPGDALKKWVLSQRGTPLFPSSTKAKIPNLNKKNMILSNTDSQSWPINDLQRALSLLGLTPGPIDGIFGYRTRSAVELFQANCGLPTDGWVGKNTSLELQKKLIDKGVTTLAALRYLNS